MAKLIIKNVYNEKTKQLYIANFVPGTKPTHNQNLLVFIVDRFELMHAVVKAVMLSVSRHRAHRVIHDR